MFWTGLSPATQAQNLSSEYINFLNHLVFFDENHIEGPVLTQQELEEGTYSKIDHYVVEWFEVHDDGTWGAIVSERKTTCMWPEATITSRIESIGELRAAYAFAPGGRALSTPLGCINCHLDEPWVRHMVVLNYEVLASECQEFGGLQWEAMKYISSNRANINPNGFTGQLGNDTTFSRQFRFPASTTPQEMTLEQIKSKGYSYGRDKYWEEISYNPESTLSVLTQLSEEIKSWNIDLTNAIVSRRNALAEIARQPQPGDLSVCCSAIDIDYLNGTCCGGTLCGGKCCPDGFICENGECMTYDYYCMSSSSSA